MIRRMSGFHPDERSATGRRYFVMCNQLAFDDSAIIAGFNHARYQPHRLIRRRRPPQCDFVVSGDGAGRMVHTGAFHQMISSGPVAMTVEQRTDNAATEHSGKCLLISFGLKLRDYFVTLRITANLQAFFIRRPATKTRIVRRVSFLNAFHDVQRPKSNVQSQELDSAVHSPPLVLSPGSTTSRGHGTLDIGLWTFF